MGCFKYGNGTSLNPIRRESLLVIGGTKLFKKGSVLWI